MSPLSVVKMGWVECFSRSVGIRYVLPVLWMSSCCPGLVMQEGVCSKWLTRGQHWIALWCKRSDWDYESDTGCAMAKSVSSWHNRLTLQCIFRFWRLETDCVISCTRFCPIMGNIFLVRALIPKRCNFFAVLRKRQKNLLQNKVCVCVSYT